MLNGPIRNFMKLKNNNRSFNYATTNSNLKQNSS